MCGRGVGVQGVNGCGLCGRPQCGDATQAGAMRGQGLHLQGPTPAFGALTVVSGFGWRAELGVVGLVGHW